MRGSRIFEARRARQLRRDQPAAEQKLWAKLRGRQILGRKFVRQEPIGPYFVDFVCREARLIVEVDGATHSTPSEVAHDRHREMALREAGYRIVRVTNDEVFRNLAGVCETILMALQD